MTDLGTDERKVAMEAIATLWHGGRVALEVKFLRGHAAPRSFRT
jgi:hypothetical protein